MWELTAAFLVGTGFGVLLLNIVARYRYGKNYNKWIKQDFELQWRSLQRAGLVRELSPFSDMIQRLSPQFCALYEEAAIAEKAPLPQVAGLAYGKALELLIKDLAKAHNPGLSTHIESIPLAACVRDYIKDDLVRNCAELATWLRNDQMHYVRRHEKHGIEELKKLVYLIVTLIEEGERRRRFATTVGELRDQLTASQEKRDES